MIVTAIADLVAAPVPMAIAVGIKPAMIEKVVIRMGRRRIRFASSTAARSGNPSANKRFIASICRMPFFFTMPNSMKSDDVIFGQAVNSLHVQ